MKLPGGRLHAQALLKSAPEGACDCIQADPYRLVARLLARLPSGSYLVISHPTDDFNPNRGESMKVYSERSAEQAVVREKTATARFFEGLELVEPGVVPVARWRPDSDIVAARPSSLWCGVARKPLPPPPYW